MIGLGADYAPIQCQCSNIQIHTSTFYFIFSFFRVCASGDFSVCCFWIFGHRSTVGELTRFGSVFFQKVKVVFCLHKHRRSSARLLASASNQHYASFRIHSFYIINLIPMHRRALGTCAVLQWCVSTLQTVNILKVYS